MNYKSNIENIIISNDIKIIVYFVFQHRVIGIIMESNIMFNKIYFKICNELDISSLNKNDTFKLDNILIIYITCGSNLPYNEEILDIELKLKENTNEPTDTILNKQILFV